MRSSIFYYPFFPLLLTTLPPRVFTFTTIPKSHRDRSLLDSSRICNSNNPIQLPDTVSVFDGSSIVDPVVVSGVFWTGLKAKIISVILGQILATLAFGILSTLAASQLPKLGNFVAQNIFHENVGNKKKNSNVYVIPKQLSKANKASPDFGKLIICIIIDAIGTSSELIPIVGEVTDLAWAPIAAIGLRSIYGSNIIFVLEFLEEILPFTDILPLATICWVVNTFYGDSDLAKALGLGMSSTDTVVNGANVIDVVPENEQRLLDKKK